MIKAAALFLLSSLAGVSARRELKTFVIDLDLPPEQRYQEMLPHFNETVWGFWNKYFAKDIVLRAALYGVSDKRGAEPDEMQREIQGLAEISRLPLKFVQAIQMLYELQTLMVPVVNFTRHEEADTFPEGFEVLKRIPWRGPGCTGIIANNTADGTVYHARNLDFSPVPVMTNLVYNGIFKKNGTELFRSQMIAGYTMVITGARFGPNGYAIERNTRYTDHKGGNKEMLHNIFSGRQLNGWTLRKILETESEYEAAVDAIAKSPYVSTEYAIVSGVKKGMIISKNPDNVAHRQVLGQANYQEPSEYIIMTNFDFFFHDIREFFDPTGHGGFGKPTRRHAAQTILNATIEAGKPLTPDVLFETINAKYVLADTVFQAVINIEKGVWNVSQPDL
mmetsp:Transcript_14341/g.28928  ORF Transcript_14341/g.28928 Transcript_14341/m.28928 type:complete len:392 (-) Transcript_14341:304-1479(-)|eukprot:CAMPEP_0167776914 /NCGR_PEP_ID=MMETSP0111_2-20121227/3393_1 /TAXON_ID=91324 /ORGANISM="Lotharella globosa, Strain CCCM811" /LENGTH=391 /DNA_ID=CAMNT_0007667021 /DNA_START=39 /DNA_END=1214 /DNA_ORIENTATION=-